MITAVQKPVEISIEDVKAIHDVTIPIAKGTIVKLVGVNGAGKSTAIQALTSAITNKNSGLTPRDGRMSGKVRMPGVTVSFGAKMSRKKTGEESPVTFAVIEDGAGVSKILNPGIKDPVAADKRRLEGILDVIGAKLSVETMQQYLGALYEEFTKARSVDGKGLVDSVNEIKLFLEAKAREVKLTVTQCDGAISEIGVIDDVVEVVASAEDLSKQVEQLAIEVRDAVRDRDRARQALETISQSETAFNIDEALAAIESLNTIIRAGESEVSSIDQQISELQKRKAVQESNLTQVRSELKLKSEMVRITKETVDRNAQLKLQIASAMSDDEIQAKQSDLEKLRAQHAEAIRVKSLNDQVASRKGRLAEINQKRADAEKQHVALKTLAHGTSGLLRNQLETVPGWTIDDDLRLCVEHK